MAKRWAAAASLLLTWAVALPAAAWELRVPAGDPLLLGAAREIMQKLRPVTELQLVLAHGEDEALRVKSGFALVRATAAREAFEGEGRYDDPRKQLRTVAMLGRQAVHLLARPQRPKFGDLRGRPVAVRAIDADTLRTVLDFGSVPLPAMHATETADPLADAAAGKIDAWFAVDAADSATAAALLAKGWQRLAFQPDQELKIIDVGWPVELAKAADIGAAGSGNVPTVAVALVADDAVPQAVVEDLTDHLLPADNAPVGQHPILAAAKRAEAAKPVPTALHRGAAASYSRLGPLNGPIEVQVTTWLYDISEIDTARNSFSADFALELRWQDARLDADKGRLFEIMNAEDVKLTNNGAVADGRWHGINVRVQAKMRAAFDWMHFPFDEQKLQIILEHPIKVADELVFRCETRWARQHIDLKKDRLGPDLQFDAWHLQSVKSQETAVPYGNQETFSRYTFTVTVKRALLPFLVQVLGPLVLLLLLAWSASLIPAEKIDAKLLLTVLALVVAVEHQAAATERAPSVDYPTFTEYLYLFAYASIALSVAQAIFEYRLHAKGDDAASRSLRNRGLLLSMASFWVPCTLILLRRLSS